MPPEPSASGTLLRLAAGMAFGLLVGFGVYQLVGSPAGEPARDPAAAPQGSPAFQALMADLEPLRERLERNPEDTDARIRIGDRLFLAGLWAQALEFYEQARQRRPRDPDLVTVIGLCQRELGRLDDAMESFQQALELDPRHWAARYNLAVVSLDRGDVERAAELAAALEAERPGDPQLAPLKRALERAGGVSRDAAARP